MTGLADVLIALFLYFDAFFSLSIHMIPVVNNLLRLYIMFKYQSVCFYSSLKFTTIINKLFVNHQA